MYNQQPRIGHMCLLLMNILYFIGYGLTLQHLRYNSEEKVYEELKPIDRNLQYDFNYQQFTHLPRTITILPVFIHHT